MKYLYIFTIILWGVLAGKADAQDSQFSQFYASPLYLSPSLAGASEMARVIVNYRSQWSSVPNAYTHYALSFDHFLDDFNSGIGAMIVRSQDGEVYNTTHMSALYSYEIPINREIKLRPGIRAGYYVRNLDYSRMEFADQMTRNSASSIEIPKEPMAEHYDFSSSLMLYSSNYWLGVTGDHLLALNSQFADNVTYPALKMTVYGGAKFDFFKSVLSKIDRNIALSFFYKDQERFQQLDLGAYYEEDPFRIGLFFRGIPAFKEDNGINAVVLLAGYNYRDFMINYSYDISMARLLATTGGTHEISLAYKFHMAWGGKSDKKGAVPCPHF